MSGLGAMADLLAGQGEGWWQVELVVRHPEERSAHAEEAGGGDEQADALADASSG